MSVTRAGFYAEGADVVRKTRSGTRVIDAKKMNIQIFIVSFIFILLSMYLNFILIEVVIDRNAEITAEIYSEQVEKTLEIYVAKMKICVERMAANQRIVTILGNSRAISDLSPKELDSLLDELDVYESALDGITFTEGIEIVSLPGKYMYSNDGIIRTYDLRGMDWFDESYFDDTNSSYVSVIHKGLQSGRDQINIVAPVYDEQKTEMIGVVMLDVYVADVVRYVEESFSYGTVELFLDNGGNYFYNKNGDVLKADYTYLVTGSMYYATAPLSHVFQNQVSLQLYFHKKTIKRNEQNTYLRRNMQGVVIFLELATGVMLFAAIRFTYRPLLRILERLKKLLRDLDDTVSLSHTKETHAMEALESLSDSLERSFDRKIKNMLYTDELTRMPNRTKLRADCEQLLEDGAPFALMFLDLNKFKHINDTYGHDVGDLILKTFASRVSEGLGEAGTLYRYAGDEFIVIFPTYESKEQITSYFQENIRPKFNQSIEVTKQIRLYLSFSCGLAVYPEDGSAYEELLQKSDGMMYQEKQSSR
jgi:diguanylate cyclase (GGDEF)-like protein